MNVERTIFRLARQYRIVMLAAIILFSGACASNKHKPHKKLKPGKPIPCPMKDC